MAAKRTPKGKLRNCECSEWEIGTSFEDENGLPDVTIETTGCAKQTNRLFAQGHDARLKSLLIRAGVAGLEVRTGRRTGLVRTMDAETAADTFGFGWQVKQAIIARLDKLAAKGRLPQQQTKTTRHASESDAMNDTAETEQVGHAATGKVGRWEYQGTENPDGTFTYLDKRENEVTVEAGRWTKIG